MRAHTHPHAHTHTHHDHRRRRATILLEFIKAGQGIEDKIALYRDEIDGTMLQLLEKRMEVAAQLEKRPEVLQGLNLLHRR
jgi:hypothetical protein